MLGRQVSSLLGRPLQARLARPTPTLQQHNLDLCIRALFSTSISRTATPGRPKKAVGEPSRPVKRAVKRTAQKPANPSTDAAAKKVAAKEKAARKKAATAAKKKTPKPKKALTEEQIARQKLRKEKATVKDLKEVALKPPHIARQSAWTVFFAENTKKKAEGSKGLPVDQIRSETRTRTREIASEWKAISPAQLEHYNHLAHTLRADSAAAYKSYVEAHTPDQIALANRARARLNALLKKPDSKRRAAPYPLIHDERAPKRATNQFALFTVSRHASGDFKHISLGEASKLLGKEWKAMDAGEKQKYSDLWQNDYKRYRSEYSDVYGHAPAALLDSQPQEAAAAAA